MNTIQRLAQTLGLAECVFAALTTCEAGSSPQTASLETPFVRFTVSHVDGTCEIVDKKAHVSWRSDAKHPHFGWVRLSFHEEPYRAQLKRCDLHSLGTELIASFQPFDSRPWSKFNVSVRALPDQRTLEISYQEDDELQVESVSLLDTVFSVANSQNGYVVVPVREGLLVPADSGVSFTNRFDTYAYEGCHMAMLGAVQNGAATLLTWSDPYVAAELRSVVDRSNPDMPGQRLSPALVLTGSARSFRVQFLGKGDYVTIAKAYRQVAREKGLLTTWEQKLKGHPERAKLFGAANFKLWSALDRRMNEQSTQQESVRTNWTFAEAAQVAEHLKNDLKLDKVLFTLGGWIHRGYDNQHPDILPAAPECGGDAAFADCARRVLKLGYLFCLHDNYQDIYRDSPSWNEGLIMKTEDHQLAHGGHWAGGMAYLICSRMAVGLAQRPQNLPGVKQLSDANSYFIDTTYAAGLQECYDPAHALTRGDDMKWKQALSDYARQVFGVFGSEDGREWAIPHSDFFEGLTGVSGHPYHDANLQAKLGASVVPLFDLVYRDCIAIYGKYGYDPNRAAEYVLRHISIGRPLNYHSVPPHLYWLRGSGREAPTPSSGAPDPAVFTRAENGWAAGLHPLDRFVKNTCEILSPLNELTARSQMSQHEFLTPDRKVQRTVFGQGATAVEVVVNMSTNAFEYPQKSGVVVLPPYGFLVQSPTFVAFHALSWGGVRYDAPAMFTLRSLDKHPLNRSRKVRVFHAFGSDQVRVGKLTHSVPTEMVLGFGS